MIKFNSEKDTLTINKERVLAAAGKCKDAARILKTIFPEAFESKGQLLELGEEITFTTISGPIMIGKSIVNDDKKFKCLVVDKDRFDVVVEDSGSYTLVSFMYK